MRRAASDFVSGQDPRWAPVNVTGGGIDDRPAPSALTTDCQESIQEQRLRADLAALQAAAPFLRC